MSKAREKQKARKKVKDLPARPMSKEAAAQVKGGNTTRFDPYKNFKF